MNQETELHVVVVPTPAQLLTLHAEASFDERPHGAYVAGETKRIRVVATQAQHPHGILQHVALAWRRDLTRTDTLHKTEVEVPREEVLGKKTCVVEREVGLCVADSHGLGLLRGWTFLL